MITAKKFFLKAIRFIHDYREKLVFFRKHFPYFLRHQKTSNSSDTNKKVLIWSFRCFPVTLFEVAVGRFLQEQGCNVTWVFCDGLCELCDSITVVDHAKKVCRSCRTYLSGLKKMLGREGFVCLKNYLGKEDERMINELSVSLPPQELLNYIWHGIKLGDIINSSAIRYLLKGDLDIREDEALIRKFFRQAMKCAMASERLFQEQKPDKLFTSHGIYVSWGIAAEIAKRRDLDITVWGQGYPENGYILVKDDTYHRIFPKVQKNEIEQLSLDKESEKMVMKYLKSREKGTSDFISYFWESESDKENVKNKLALKDRFTIGIFTNF